MPKLNDRLKEYKRFLYAEGFDDGGVYGKSKSDSKAQIAKDLLEMLPEESSDRRYNDGVEDYIAAIEAYCE